MKRVVIWGGRENLHSHRWVQAAFYANAGKLGIPAVWLADAPGSVSAIQAGDTVIAADVLAEHLDYTAEVNYCLHNFDGASDLCRALEDTPERLLRLQVWTNAASGEEWDLCRQFDRSARTLFEPWGTDLLVEEFMEPVFVPESRRVVFVGAVWSDEYEGTELGNRAVISALKDVCASRNLVFAHRTQIPDSENVRLVRDSRLAPALAGKWQVDNGYVSCRSLKNVSYGALCISNVAAVKRIMGGAVVEGESVEELVDAALSLNRTRYLNFVREQQRQVARYTYRQSFESIERAFAEIAA